MKFEFRELKQGQLDKQNTAKMDIKETGWWALDWIYLIELKVRSRAFVNMVMKSEKLCDCQRAKKTSTPLIMFVTRHTILDLVYHRGKQVLYICRPVYLSKSEFCLHSSVVYGRDSFFC